MSFFDVIISLRIRKNVLDEAEKIYLANQDKYESLSHYIRSAIIKQNNEVSKK